MLSLAINLSQILRRNKKLSSPRKTKACSRYCRDRLGVRPGVKILLKNLRSSFESLRTNGEAVEIMGDFSVHAERVEAFLGFFSIIDHRHILDTQHRAGMNLVPMLLPTGWQLLARVALMIR